MWMVDIAREQLLGLEELRRLCDLTLAGGYNALGLYFEHRFATPSLPWAAGVGATNPDDITILQSEYPNLQLIPFLNLLGHFEGMLYTEHGKRYREETLRGMQACPSCPEFTELAERLIDDAVSIFRSEWIHVGGDETYQLGRCERCKARIAALPEGTDGKAHLYGEHFGPLARKVLAAGRRPAVWGDMFLDHPTALEAMPKETVIFDWQYFGAPEASAIKFREAGFEVVLCPTIQTYSAIWCHLPVAERNVRDHVRAVPTTGALGVCVTTWEYGLMGNLATLGPALRAAGDLLSADPSNVDLPDEPEAMLAAYERASPAYRRWAELMGVELNRLGGVFRPDGHRHRLKSRLLLYSNPFLAWVHHREELCGPTGDAALKIAQAAVDIAPDSDTRGLADLLKQGILFVQFVERAAHAYAEGKPGEAITALSPARQVFEDLEKIAQATLLNVGGSRADVERCRIARQAVETAIKRIKLYGDGSLGYLPAFEILTHPKFVPHDQACWWLVNDWGNE